MKALKKLWTYAVIMAVAGLSALSYALFVLPNRFAPAGINGLCTMIQYVSGISIGYLSLLINIPLAIWVYLKISKPMALRSMAYVLTFSLGTLLLGELDLSKFAYVTDTGTSTILGPLVAGIINGAGLSLLVKASAYSGGTDFIAAIIHKKNPEMGMFWLIFALNVAVACCSFFVYEYQIEPVILCILYCFMSSTVSDRMTKGGRQAIRFEIVTDYPQEISDAIIHQLHHSATLIPGRGMYLGRQTNILICVINKTQIAALSEIIRRYPNTFAVMSQVGEVMGNFKKISKSGRQEQTLLDQGDGSIL